MAGRAATLLVAFALSARVADAAVTCASGWTAKTSVDDKKCTSDAASCQKDATCCTAPTTCAGSTPTCDTADYNKADATVVPSGGDAKKLCCVKKATCNDATCPAGQEVDTAKKDDKCTGAAATCSAATCCKQTAGTCSAWFAAANTNVCAATDMKVADLSKKFTAGKEKTDCCVTKKVCTGYKCPDATHKLKANDGLITCPTGTCTNDLCCESKVVCTGHKCPDATHQLKANDGLIKCPTGTCSNDLCCDYKSTVCGSTPGSCTGDNYYDKSKALNVFKTAATDCCSKKATCKDTANLNAAGGSAPTGPQFFALMSALIFALSK